MVARPPALVTTGTVKGWASFENALKSEQLVRSALQYYEKPQLLQKADGVMRLLKFHSEFAIFAKNLPATVDVVSMETSHKAIDEFLPVV